MVGDEDDDERDYSRLEAPLQPDDLYGGDGRETWGRRAERRRVSRKMALRKMAATSLKHRLATMRKTSVTRAVVKEVVARQSRTMIGAQLDPDVVRRRAELCDGPDEAEEDGERQVNNDGRRGYRSSRSLGASSLHGVVRETVRDATQAALDVGGRHKAPGRDVPGTHGAGTVGDSKTLESQPERRAVHAAEHQQIRPTLRGP